ncbi:4-carboxymuconolactone decarboxylase/cardiolipin synthase [Pseudonocardia ammonioxydans]|uniref:4-carboxymuconolactone decarboxylase/cardiolipin synthase n=1 Tax=Pseudonocardia ammonioxydans TaxID=260086 RepID=A0A1I4SGB3_PSUAM|nr:4-carboxymuconolactone decarboxylase/cardiolipin synthase [Pseudonocardia ammonioxydans]
MDTPPIVGSAGVTTDDPTAPALRGRPQPSGPPRTVPLDPAGLDDERAALHARIATGPRKAQARVPLVDDGDRLLGPFGVMLFSPRIGDAVQQVGAALRVDDDLPPRLRELAVLAVAAHHRSAFEWTAHEDLARECGLSGPQLQALLDGAVPDGLDDAERVALDTVRALLSGHDLDDDRYAAALAALGRDTLAALVWLTGYYGMLATALAVFRPG